MLIDALEQTSDAEKFCSRKGRERATVQNVESVNT